MKQKRIAAYRFDNAAELREEMDTLLDNARMLNAAFPDTIINRDGTVAAGTVGRAAERRQRRL